MAEVGAGQEGDGFFAGLAAFLGFGVEEFADFLFFNQNVVCAVEVEGEGQLGVLG